MNLDKRNLIIEKGAWAEKQIKDPIFEQVIDDLLKRQFAMFTLSEREDIQGREEIYQLLKGVQAFEAELESLVQDKNHVLKEEKNNNERREE